MQRPDPLTQKYKFFDWIESWLAHRSAVEKNAKLANFKPNGPEPTEENIKQYFDLRQGGGRRKSRRSKSKSKSRRKQRRSRKH